MKQNPHVFGWFDDGLLVNLAVNLPSLMLSDSEEAMIACHGVSASSASCSAAVAALFFGEGTEFASVAVPSLTGHRFVGQRQGIACW